MAKITGIDGFFEFTFTYIDSVLNNEGLEKLWPWIIPGIFSIPFIIVLGPFLMIIGTALSPLFIMLYLVF